METPLLNARVPHDVMDALDELAAQAGTSRSDQVRQALAAWVTSRGDAPDVDAVLAATRDSLAALESILQAVQLRKA